MRIRTFCSLLLSLALTHSSLCRAQATAPSDANTPPAKGPSTGAKAPKDARALFTAMATIPGLEARFREEKQLALLRAPLVSEGRLYYKRGGYLARITEKPSSSAVRITPSALEVNNGEGFQRIDLTGRADIKLFVESFARVLAGDYEALSSLYTITFQAVADSGRWRLTLVPKAGNLVHLVKAMVLEGVGYGVDLIRVQETKGDSAVTHVELVSASRSYSQEEERRLFGAQVPTP